MKRRLLILVLVGLFIANVVSFALVLSQSAGAARRVCAEGNKFRDAERGLWNKVFSYQTPYQVRHLPAKQRQQLYDFRAYIVRTFARVDCGTGKATLAPPAPPPPPFPSPSVMVKVNPKTQTRTVTVTVPGPTRYVTRTVVVCRRPNGKRC